MSQILIDGCVGDKSEEAVHIKEGGMVAGPAVKMGPYRIVVSGEIPRPTSVSGSSYKTNSTVTIKTVEPKKP